MNKFFASLVIFCGLNSMASESKKIEVHGIVQSFDETYVVLDQDSHKFRVPRKAFTEKLQSGMEVSVEIDRQEIFKK